MSQGIRTLVVILSTVFGLAAQQPNSSQASLVIGGTDGPPWPIKSVLVENGVPLVATFAGSTPLAPLALAISGGVEDVGRPMLGGNLMDLTEPGVIVILGPTLPPPNALDLSGALSFAVYPQGLGPAAAFGAQGVIADAAAPAGATLTAATRLTAGSVTVLPHALGDDNAISVSLPPYGLSLPFYGVNYTSYFVNANGFVSFGQATTDFTSSPAEFTTLMPRIALMWTDLSPQIGGNVQSRILAAGAGSEVRIDYLGVPDYGTGGPIHDMSVVLRSAPDGSIDIIHPATQMPSQYTMMTGITAGFAGVSALPVDLSVVQDTGGQAFPAGVPIFEWYGFAGQTYYSGPTNLFDLVGRGLRFVPIPDPTTPAATPGALGYWLQ